MIYNGKWKLKNLRKYKKCMGIANRDSCPIMQTAYTLIFNKGKVNISISPLRLHYASSVQIPSSTRKFNTMLPSIKIRPLNILSASSVNLHGITNSNVFHIDKL